MPTYKNVLANSGNQNHMDEMKVAAETGSNHLVYMIDPANFYKMCETYHFYFTSTGATNYPCLLTIGALSATTACTIGNYVIEWHLNSLEGSVILTSGVGTDPNYPGMVQHPFTNQPVPGGVLYPVIVYIYVDGYKYTSQQDGSARYSPDLKGCISPIAVFDMNCYNGYQGATPPLTQYSHWITYNYSTSSPNQASRELSFVLNTGGTTKYLAWYFAGYYYADKIKFTYVRYADMYETVLDYWNIGQTATPTDFTTNPKKWSGTAFKFITNLTGMTYNNGDYIKIDITPNESNPLTNWDLYLKCKGTEFTCLSLNSLPNGWNYPDTGTTVMTSGTTNGLCSYTLTFNSLSGYNYTLTDFYKYYMSYSIFGSGTAGYDSSTDTLSCTSYIYTGHTYYSVSTGSSTACTGFTDTYTITKSGSYLTFTFNNSADFTTYKNAYDSVKNTPGMSGYTGTNTDFNHYKFFYLYIRSGTTCGDSQTEKYIYFHYSSVINWDSTGKTFTIVLTNTTNGIAEVACNTAHYYIDALISNVASSISESNYTWSSIKIGGQSPFYGLAMWLSPNFYTNDLTKEFYWYIQAHPTLVNGVCSLSSWYYSSPYYYLYKLRVKVVITNASDPVNNYQLYQGLDSNGAPTTYTLIYQKP